MTHDRISSYVAARHFGFVFCVLTVTGIAAAQVVAQIPPDSNTTHDENAAYQVAAKEYARLALELSKTKYWNPTEGFTRPPMKIYDEFGYSAEKGTSRMRQLDEQHPLLWKGVAFELGELYATDQKRINDKRVKNARAIRRHLSSALEHAVSARGGGSASMVLNAIAPAQTEWMIKRMTVGEHEPISDKKFLATLAFHVGNYNPDDLRHALAALKKAEPLMATSESASVRYEFLAYFEQSSYGSPR